MSQTRIRPLRRFICQEATLCGVRTGDGVYVAAGTGIGFAVPLFLNITFYGIPGSLVFSVVALFISVYFFRWVRKNHHPKWLEQAACYYWREIFGRTNDLRRARVGRARITWIIDYHEIGGEEKLWLEKKSTSDAADRH